MIICKRQVASDDHLHFLFLLLLLSFRRLVTRKTVEICSYSISENQIGLLSTFVFGETFKGVLVHFLETAKTELDSDFFQNFPDRQRQRPNQLGYRGRMCRSWVNVKVMTQQTLDLGSSLNALRHLPRELNDARPPRGIKIELLVSQPLKSLLTSGLSVASKLLESIEWLCTCCQ